MSRLSVVFVGPHLDSCPHAIVWRWVGRERLLSQTTPSAPATPPAHPLLAQVSPRSHPHVCEWSTSSVPINQEGMDTSSGFPSQTSKGILIHKYLLTSTANPCLGPRGDKGKPVLGDPLLSGGDTHECVECPRLTHDKHSRTPLIVK